MSKYKILPEKENFLKLRECDFNVLPEKKEELENPEKYLKEFTEMSRIPGTLKKVTNPILILFYYNNTDEKILTEFYESSYSKDYQKGEKNDKIFDEKDLDFKFGFVNLDLEKNIEETFREMIPTNPFAWAKIEELNAGAFSKEPFILFYYQSLPQLNYEGIVDSEVIKEDFKNWRKELMEVENKETRKEINLQGYYVALKDNFPFNGIVEGKTYWISSRRVSPSSNEYRYDFKLIN